MANYVIKEIPTGMGNGSEGKQFPKMQVYTEFDYDKVVELVHTNSPAFSEATVRGVLDTLAVVMKSYLPMGHTMKIDNLGVFSNSRFTEGWRIGVDKLHDLVVVKLCVYLHLRKRFPFTPIPHTCGHFLYYIICHTANNFFSRPAI